MPGIATIRELLGGEAVVGPLRSDGDLMRLVRRGVPTSAVDHFLASAGLSFNAIDRSVLNRRTFKRRQDADQPLDQEESDRLIRLVSVVATASDVFGDPDKANVWLARPNRALDGEVPLAMADTDRGARAVETLLGRIAHGIAA